MTQSIRFDQLVIDCPHPVESASIKTRRESIHGLRSVAKNSDSFHSAFEKGLTN